MKKAIVEARVGQRGDVAAGETFGEVGGQIIALLRNRREGPMRFARADRLVRRRKAALLEVDDVVRTVVDRTVSIGIQVGPNTGLDYVVGAAHYTILRRLVALADRAGTISGPAIRYMAVAGSRNATPGSRWIGGGLYRNVRLLVKSLYLCEARGLEQGLEAVGNFRGGDAVFQSLVTDWHHGLFGPGVRSQGGCR